MPILPQAMPNLGKDYTWAGLHTFAHAIPSAVFTGPPTGTTSTTSTLVVNPASATADADLIWAGLAGTVKFWVDEDGDTRAIGKARAGNVQSDSYVYVSGGSAFLVTDATYFYHYTTRSGGSIFYGDDVFADRVSMGAGVTGQRALAAHLDQPDVTIRRDVDGVAGPYNEAGCLLLLDRDVTNVGSETGDFLRCYDTPTTTFLFNITESGGLHMDGDFNHDGTNFGVCGTAPQAQQAHIVDAANAAGDPPTQAEYNAFVAKFNTLLADLEGFGFLAAV